MYLSVFHFENKNNIVLFAVLRKNINSIISKCNGVWKGLFPIIYWEIVKSEELLKNILNG